ncbi:MAG: dihydroxyacetone kinase subunit DhaL [Chloroflexota bacterium]
MLTSADIVDALRRGAVTIARHEALLDRLDAALGDGDHGANMVVGLDAVVAALGDRYADGDRADIGGLLRLVGHTLVSSVGGASGPLYGTAFIEAGFAFAGASSLDLAEVADAFEVGTAALARRGRCAVGDKTILDALEPAMRVLREATHVDRPLPDAFADAAIAARAGMIATIPMVARRGLALRLGERSRGHQDPGATSCFLLVRAISARADRFARLS